LDRGAEEKTEFTRKKKSRKNAPEDLPQQFLLVYQVLLSNFF
jgi:hypothetical protein